MVWPGTVIQYAGRWEAGCMHGPGLMTIGSEAPIEVWHRKGVRTEVPPGERSLWLWHEILRRCCSVCFILDAVSLNAIDSCSEAWLRNTRREGQKHRPSPGLQDCSSKRPRLPGWLPSTRTSSKVAWRTSVVSSPGLDEVCSARWHVARA